VQGKRGKRKGGKGKEKGKRRRRRRRKEEWRKGRGDALDRAGTEPTEKVINKKRKNKKKKKRKQEKRAKAIALSRKSAFRGYVLGARDDVSQDGRPPAAARSSSSLRVCTATLAGRNDIGEDFDQIEWRK